MNIFTKIGNRIEKVKEKRKDYIEKYWKLSPIERIDFDNKLRYLEKYRYKPFSFIIFFAKLYLSVITFLFIIMIGIGNYELFPSIQNVITSLISISWVIILVDITFAFTDQTEKRIKELKRRFKLC